MQITRLAALTALSALTLVPACDPKSDNQYVAADAGDEEGAEQGDEDAQPEPEPPAEDFGRMGEGCDQSELSAACRIDGADGVEFCVWSLAEYDYHWTACLPETCATAGDERACTGGKQYCVEFEKLVKN